MKLILRVLPYVIGIAGTVFLTAIGSGFAAYYYLKPALPSVAEMRDIPLQIPLRIYSRDGRLIQQIGEKRRTPVAYNDIPELVVQAFLAAEDDRFFQHPGFDYQGIMRAGIAMLATGSRAQGGSTITQQLAREYFLTRDRTFVRKAKELILAVQIESSFSKQQILELYLNKIFLGQRAYGVAAAAEVYFGKTLQELSIAEAATIAGLPAAPSRLNPVSGPDQARDRRSYVLRRMLELDFISEEEFTTALNTPVESKLHGPKLDIEAPYVAEMARDEAVRRLGETATTDGYQVITTIDSRLQRAAGNALRTALLEYDRRHGFRGAITRVDVSRLTAAQSPPESSNTTTDGETVDIRLQNILRTYPVFGDLRPAVVTRINPQRTNNGPAANSAEFFVSDTGYVNLPWDSIKWRAFINDNAVGAAQGSVADMLAPGDIVYLRNTDKGWQLSQVPAVQGALVAMDPQDGATAALAGGFDFYQSKFNRATQALRQPGSSFKPFIYSAALDNGFTVSSIVNDAPIVLDASGGQDAWRPQNYSRKFYGPTRLREGLVRSMNLVTVRILMKIGIKNAFKHLRPFGFDDAALPPNLSLALGSGGASPWLMAQAFSSLSSGGYGVKRHIIDRILDAEGNLIYAASEPMVCEPCAPHWFDGRETADPASLVFLNNGEPLESQWNESVRSKGSDANAIDPEIPFYESAEAMMAHALEWRPDYIETPSFWSDRNQADRIVSAPNAYIVYDMMRDVIRRGTGQRAKALGRQDLGGKTGTSNDRRDAWFGGFNSQLVGVAWVGFDDDARTLGEGEEGGRTALPMWINLMDVALKGTAEAPLQQPPGIVSMRVSRNTGQLAGAGSPDAMFEIFIAGSEPGSGYDQAGMGSDDIFIEDTGNTSLF